VPESLVVRISVVLLQWGERYLATFNAQWGAFTLPMTRLKRLDDPEVPGMATNESWVDAALRVMAEYLGRTTTLKPELALEVPQSQQSQRSGELKRYHFKVFRFVFAEEPKLAPGVVAEWLTADEFMDERRQPISTTARDVFVELRNRRKDR